MTTRTSFSRIVVAILFLLPAISACGNPRFVISGVVKPSIQKAEIVLSYAIGERQVHDTVKVTDGKFTANGQVPYPLLANIELRLNETGSIQQEFFLENGNLSIVIDTANRSMQVTGSKSNELLEPLNRNISVFDTKRDSIAAMYQSVKEKRDEAVRTVNKTGEANYNSILKRLEEVYDSLDIAKNPVYQQFVDQHPHSYVSLFALGQIYRFVIKSKEARASFETLDKQITQSEPGKEFLRKLQSAERTDSGRVAIPFQQQDINGKIVSLSDYKGKYLLLDFWASWCGPCRKENPKVVKLYRTYKDRGLSIVGVALERSRDPWIEAIRKDSLDWVHISDLKFFDNTVAKDYGIWSIPQNILVNPQGIIIGKNLSSEQLDSLLKRLL